MFATLNSEPPHGVPRAPPGVPLARYGEDGPMRADVLVVCNGCASGFTVKLAMAMRRACLAGKEPATFGICAFGPDLVSDPCGKCGALAWASRPDFAPTPGAPRLFSYPREPPTN